MEELVNEIASEIIVSLKYRTRFWSFYWKGALRDKLVREIEAHLTKHEPDAVKSRARKVVSPSRKGSKA